MRDRTTFHAAISKASWTYGEEELKMIYMAASGRGPEAGHASGHCQLGTKHLASNFYLSNYFQDGFFVFKPSKYLHAPPRQYRCMISAVNQTGVA
jgi:hypothetical protein